jgi:hypothetical protein
MPFHPATSACAIFSAVIPACRQREPSFILGSPVKPGNDIFGTKRRLAERRGAFKGCRLEYGLTSPYARSNVGTISAIFIKGVLLFKKGVVSTSVPFHLRK